MEMALLSQAAWVCIIDPWWLLSFLPLVWVRWHRVSTCMESSWQVQGVVDPMVDSPGPLSGLRHPLLQSCYWWRHFSVEFLHGIWLQPKKAYLLYSGPHSLQRTTLIQCLVFSEVRKLRPCTLAPRWATLEGASGCRASWNGTSGESWVLTASKFNLSLCGIIDPLHPFGVYPEGIPYKYSAGEYPAQSLLPGGLIYSPVSCAFSCRNLVLASVLMLWSSWTSFIYLLQRMENSMSRNCLSSLNTVSCIQWYLIKCLLNGLIN